MTKLLKKHDFSLKIERFFTTENVDAFEAIHFREPDSSGSQFAPTLECPDNWSAEAAAMLAENAASQSIPATTHSIEENTIPSWLWRRIGNGNACMKETSARHIFHRVAGAAAYAGWKNGVLNGETEARTFFDEIRYMLAQRFIALEPRYLASIGLDWAYGIERKAAKPAAPMVSVAFEAAAFDKKAPTVIDIHNASIDALLGGDKDIRRKWQKFLAAGIKTGALALSFTDIAADWNVAAPGFTSEYAGIDLLACRRDDGTIDIERLCHAVRLLVAMLDLLEEQPGALPAIGLYNLAPLLMSQALPYSGNAGRTTAAALAAIVTAEAYATSARLAALRGPSLDFAAHREGILRSLRNHRRAAYGDRNDYEKISVLPAPLTLDPGADLALVAAARRGWDNVLELVHQHGLRSTRLTDLLSTPMLAFFMESTAQGAEPISSLTVAHATESDVYRRDIHPAVTEALVKLGYDADARQAIIAHVAGTQTLAHAPGIDHASLRHRGFDDEAIGKIEHYLPFVTDVRLAITPWIVGEDFCRDVLKMPAEKMRQARFNLLQALGFSIPDIEAANAFCYGSGSVRGAPVLKPAHAAVFARADEIFAEARIRMAAAMQSFIGGDAELLLSLPDGVSAAECERLLLAAWRHGVKSVAIEFSAAAQPEKKKPEAASHAAREKRPAIAPPTYSAPLRSALRGKPKAQSRLVSLGRGQKSPPESRKDKRS